MGWKFWEKSITSDTCSHTGVDLLGHLDHVPLHDGHYTSFMLMKCTGCGGMVGFPQSNLDLALLEGTQEVKYQLRVLAEKVLFLR